MSGIVPLTSPTHMTDEILEHGRKVLRMEASGISRLGETLGADFVAAAKALLNLGGRAVVSGMGKSGHIAGKIAATLASTGTPSFFLHAAEAAHGDLGMISPQDLVILISNSGETPELVPIIQHITRLHIPMIGISAAANSILMRNATFPLLLPILPEACPVGIAPTTSTAMTLALGDALAMVVMHERGFSRADFKLLHPGGQIGLRLMKVSEIMHRGERMPLVVCNTPMVDAVMVMTAKSFGIIGVADANGQLVGVVTDGDLRRNIHQLNTALVEDVMTQQPCTIAASTLAEDALKYLNARQVTALFVVPDDIETSGRTPIGIVNVHDFLRLGLS